tara:strand:+ start:1652 stop:3121 length:1470 start_codon:yes stop_codon:yes gene_type:complete
MKLFFLFFIPQLAFGICKTKALNNSLEEIITRVNSAQTTTENLISSDLLIQKVFSLDNENYSNALLILSEKIDPNKLPSIAIDLQTHWESHCAKGSQRIRNLTIDAGAGIGTVSGIGLALAFYFILKKHPEKISSYFKFLRGTLPVVGFVAGKSTGEFLSRSATEKAPPSHLIQLEALPSDPFPLLNGPVTTDLFFKLGSFVSGSFLAEALIGKMIQRGALLFGGVNRAATPAKAHPLVFAGSIVAGVLVEEQAYARYQKHKKSNHTKDYLSSIDEFKLATTPHQRAIYGHRIAKDAQKLAYFLFQPVYEETIELTSEAFENPTELSKKESNELFLELLHVFNKHKMLSHFGYSGFLTRERIIHKDWYSLAAFEPHLKELAWFYRDFYLQKIKPHQEEQIQSSMLLSLKEDLYSKWVEKMNLRYLNSLLPQTSFSHPNSVFLHAIANLHQYTFPGKQTLITRLTQDMHSINQMLNQFLQMTYEWKEETP